jgi:O-acetyl-ADP-ribose deacetylase (regulator of RNase III)
LIREMPPTDSILESPADVLVCPVNMVPGVMGAGLAKAFADRWPTLKWLHRKAIQDHQIVLGNGDAVWLRDVKRPNISCLGIYLFPTKDDWRKPSKIEWIAAGLDSLEVFVVHASDPSYGDRRLRSVAIPALGAGLGGLPWATVRPLILSLCERYPAIDWTIYPPR